LGSSGDEIFRIYFIVVDQIVIFIRVNITHSRVSIGFLLERCREVSVLVRKYEAKAQTYENPDDKSEN
jgi:hypothetical protein